MTRDEAGSASTQSVDSRSREQQNGDARRTAKDASSAAEARDLTRREAASVQDQKLAGTDEDVLALARSGGAGDFRAAASALFRRYLRELYAHVKSRLPEDEAAVQDILQEVALAVVEGLPRLREGAALRPWMLQIASHKVCDHLRRTVRERSRHDRDMGASVLEHLEDPSGNMESLLERADEAQLAAYLRRAVDHLNPHQQAAVRLVYFDGVPFEEAATRLGIRNDALASLLYRARRQFMKDLERYRRAGAAPGVDAAVAQRPSQTRSTTMLPSIKATSAVAAAALAVAAWVKK